MGQGNGASPHLPSHPLHGREFVTGWHAGLPHWVTQTLVTPLFITILVVKSVWWFDHFLKWVVQLSFRIFLRVWSGAGALTTHAGGWEEQGFLCCSTVSMEFLDNWSSSGQFGLQRNNKIHTLLRSTSIHLLLGLSCQHRLYETVIHFLKLFWCLGQLRKKHKNSLLTEDKYLVSVPLKQYFNCLIVHHLQRWLYRDFVLRVKTVKT